MQILLQNVTNLYGSVRKSPILTFRETYSRIYSYQHIITFCYNLPKINFDRVQSILQHIIQINLFK